MKKILCLILALIMSAFALVACNDTELTSTDSSNSQSGLKFPEGYENHVAPKASEIDMTTANTLDGVTVSDTETDYVLVTVDGYGQILIRLYPDVAPITVTNFKKLVSENFYDGLIFHRVIKNFMIQGGDPLGNGTGGADENIYGEFKNNGFENNLAHKRGVVAMARSTENSASSQFYICHKTSGVEHLDGDYATFGYVIYGMDVVDKIAKVNVDSNDKPIKTVVITSIRFANVPDSVYAPVESGSTSTLPDEYKNHVPPKADSINMTAVASLDGITESETATDYVLIDVAGYGKMLVRLYPDVAPATVANFKKLVSEKFYDGLTFHRVEKDFVIQCGDPTATGMGGSSQTIFGEFASNGFENNLAHKRGVLSMARRSDSNNSASSQFFICHTDAGVAHLDGNYAAFGYVVYGLDVIDSIASVSVNASSKPAEDVVIAIRKSSELLFFIDCISFLATNFYRKEACQCHLLHLPFFCSTREL